MVEKLDENKFEPLLLTTTTISPEKGAQFDDDDNWSEGDDVHEDRLTKLTGVKGKWQFVTVLTVELSVILHSMQMFANKWMSFPVDHWCARPAGLNLTADEWRNISAPLLPNGAYDKCNVFDISYDVDTERPQQNATDIVPCFAWEYDHSMFTVHIFFCPNLSTRRKGRPYLSRSWQPWLTLVSVKFN